MASQASAAAAPVRASRRSRMRAIGDTAPVRFFVAHPDLSAALFFALLVLIYLWPALVGGQMLSPLTVLYGMAPWRASAPADVASYYNPLLSDVPMADYPWRWYTRELIRDGTLPLWNPHIFGGIPFMSNPQIGLYSPFNIPLWVAPFHWALGLSAAIKLWAGGFGTYLVARQLRLGFLPGLLGGVAFSFCALNITWLTHETLPAVAVLLPWMIWLTERIFERGRLGTALWLGVATAIGLGGGHPGMQVHLMAITGLYALVRMWLVPELERGDRLRRFALVVGGLVIGILVMAVMLIPEVLSSRDTIGTRARAGGEGTLPGTIMPFDAIKTVIFPDWWGRPSSVEVNGSATSAGTLVNYNERTFYGGVVALLFGFVAIVSRGGWRVKGPFALLAFLGLAIPLHMPGLWQFVTNVPPFDLVQNQRMHFVYAFGIAVLAAFGLRELLDRPAEEKWRLAVPAVALLLGLFALSAIRDVGGAIGDTFEHFVSGTSFAAENVLALTSVAWFLLLVLGVGIALIAAIRWPRARYAIAVAVVALAVVDALHFADGYQPVGPESGVVPPRTEAIRYLQEHADEGRIMGLQYAVANDWSMIYGLSDVRGYDPPNPTQRFFDLWRVANPTQADWTPFSMDGIGPDQLQIVSVLGARYVIDDPGVQPLDVRADPSLAALRPVYTGDDATIYQNDKAMPRASVAPRVTLAADEDETRALLARTEFSPARATIVETDQRAAAALADGPVVRGSARIVDEQNAQVTMAATLDRRGLVVLNDSYGDGWTVTVDGEDADPVRVNSVMRGVVVDAGDHEIVWSYSLPGLKAGALLSLVTVLGMAAAAIFLVVRRRRRDVAA